MKGAVDPEGYVSVIGIHELGTTPPPRSGAGGPIRREKVARAIVFADPRSLALMKRVRALAPSDANVLVSGETGTGKELIARQIHALSARCDGPFVAMSGCALPDSLIDAELFGFERGAFTGAASGRIGWFEAANGGTLFLDKIGDLPLAAQVKLLRVLQEREVVRIGSRTPLPVDLRLIAATHVDLPAAIRTGRFREDLYYRIRVAEIDVPPLRERPLDIPPLVEHFLDVYAARLGRPKVGLSPDALRALLAHPWPGNIRELENAVHNALLEERGGLLQPQHFRLITIPHGSGGCEADGPGSVRAEVEEVVRGLLGREMPDLYDLVTRTLLLGAYELSGRNQIQTAQLLGISRTMVRTALSRAGVLPPRRKRRSPEAVGTGRR